MKLDDWLRAQKMTSAQFARSSGIGSKQAVHKSRHGQRFPTRENLWRIHAATNGEVTANDFMDQHPPAADTDTTPSPREPAEAAE